MMRSEWLQPVIMAALATAAMITVACGGDGPVQAAESQQEATPTAIQYGTLDEGNAAEVVPGHTSPEPGALVTNLIPEFAWTDVPGASGFQVQVSDDVRFLADRTIDSGVIESLSWTAPEEITAGKTYYWRARAVFPLGAIGGWSDYSPFSSPPPVLAEPPGPSGSGNGAGNGVEGVRIAVGDHGAVVATLAIWDASSNVLMTTGGRTLEEVLKDLKRGRVYQFAATLDMVLYPRDFGVDRAPVYLIGGRPTLVFW